MKAAVFVLCLMAPAYGAQACDVALALTVDVSGSVDPTEFRIQMDGLADALDNGDVRDALLTAQAQIAVMQWSGANRQNVTVAWASMRTNDDIDNLVTDIKEAPRAYRHFSTAIGDAILAAAAYHDERSVECARSVIDVSGDGPSNEGVALTDMKRRLAQSGITVNGLAIEQDDEALSGYFNREVVTGPGAFVVTARSFEDYRRAIRRKLLREIATPIVARPSAAMLADASQTGD